MDDPYTAVKQLSEGKVQAIFGAVANFSRFRREAAFEVIEIPESWPVYVYFSDNSLGRKLHGEFNEKYDEFIRSSRYVYWGRETQMYLRAPGLLPY
jgi:hypothetical protein